MDQSKLYACGKRCFDVAAAVTLLALTWPVWLLAAALIRWQSPGPVLFCQTRVGRDGRPFGLIKFRTMHVRSPEQAGSTVTVRDDPRVFPVGRALRRSKIDELPQVLNVLIGHMSLVGPRPTVSEDYQRMNARQRTRCAVLPGLTGLAQIRGNTALSWPQRIEWDLKYVAERGWRLDAAILRETAWLLLRGRLATDPPAASEWQEAA